jgi:hypothetical protein
VNFETVQCSSFRITTVYKALIKHGQRIVKGFTEVIITIIDADGMRHLAEFRMGYLAYWQRFLYRVAQVARVRSIRFRCLAPVTQNDH